MKIRNLKSEIRNGKIVLALLMLVCLPAYVFADARGHEAHRVTINAGVLIAGNTPADRTFLAMDRRDDLKPPGWEFVNPNAPSGLAKHRRRYWLVDINTLSADQIQKYHVLLINSSGVINMSIENREKLRRFVEGGGVLWLDRPAAGWTRGTPTFFPDVTLTTGGTGTQIKIYGHPLFQGYYTLSPGEIYRLGLRGRGISTGAALELRGSPVLTPLVVATSATQETPVIASAIYGSGRILATSAGIADAINIPIAGDQSNSQLDRNLSQVPAPELKFAYNLVRWASTSISRDKDGRMANSAFDRYGAPLAVKWRDPQAQFSQTGGTPAIYQGFIFVIQGGNLVCYDANPQRDADGDGFNDDGAMDFSQGTLYDKVWTAPIGGSTTSSPMIIETPTGTQVVVVVSGGGGAEVRGYYAAPRDSNGRLLSVNDFVWRQSLTNGTGPANLRNGTGIASPVYHEGILMVPYVGTVQSGTFGASVMMQAFWIGDGTNNGTTGVQSILSDAPNRPDPTWYQPRRVSAGTEWITPVAAGYVSNKGTGGGNDFVLYFGTNTEVGSGTVIQNVEGVRAFWIGTKGEQLTATASPQVYSCRITNQSQARIYTGPIQALQPRVYQVDVTGAITDVTGLCLFNETAGGSGRIRIQGADPTNTNLSYYIDYFIDWASVETSLSPMFRSYFTMPNNVGPDVTQYQNRIVGITLAPTGILYIATGTSSADGAPPFANGNLLAVQEQRSDSRHRSLLLWRWQSHGGYTENIPGQQPMLMPAAMRWQEPNPAVNAFLGSFLNFSQGAQPQNSNRDMYFRFVHAPVYRDGVIYVLGEGEVRLGGFVTIPYTVLMAFDAEPPQFVIDLGAPIAALPNVSLTLSQTDYARGGPGARARGVLSYAPGAPSGLLKVEYNSGQIRIAAFQESTNNGTMNLLNGLSLSQPVVVQIGTFNALVNPDSGGVKGNWSNLRWYTVMIGSQAKGSPVTIGDLVYVPFTGVSPDRQVRGGIMAFSSNPKREQPGLALGGQAGIIPNPPDQSAIYWPYVQDLNPEDYGRSPFGYFREFFNRLAQSWVFGQDVSPIAFGEGMLVINGSGNGGQGSGNTGGMYAYERQSTLIADQNRLVEVGTDGLVQWSTENSQAEVPVGTGTILSAKTGFGTVSRVQRMSRSERLVVDTTHERVVVVDSAGNEVRSITGFLPDTVMLRNPNGTLTENSFFQLRDPAHPNFNNLLSSNWVSGTPTNLRAPTDASVWTEYVPEAVNPFVQRRPLEYWIHYVIADSGNNRLLDIIDRYEADPNTFTIGNPVIVQAPNPDGSRNTLPVPQLGVLYWMSPTSKLGQEYKYVGVQRFEYIQNNAIKVGYAALVQNYQTAGASLGTDPQTPDAGTILIHVAENGANRIANVRRMRLPDGREVPILAPTSLSVSSRHVGTEPVPGLFVLVCTSTGVYELSAPQGDPMNETWIVTWMLTNEAYSNAVRRQIDGRYLSLVDQSQNPALVANPIRQPILFRPLQAKQLSNGNVLIVNNYVGTTYVRDGNTERVQEFLGEVLEIRADDYDPSNTDNDKLLGFNNRSILWSTADRPQLTGSAPIRIPTAADR